MNTKCAPCKGTGVIQRDGKMVGNHQPYTLTCSSCNGIGHHREPGDYYEDEEEIVARAVLRGEVALLLPLDEVNEALGMDERRRVA